VYALARYDGPARRLVLAYKERGRRDLTAALGRALAAALPFLPEVGLGGGGPESDGAREGSLSASRAREGVLGASRAREGVLGASHVREGVLGANRARDGAPESSLTRRAVPDARNSWDGVLWLVPAPSRRSASRARGGPHVLRLARACAGGLAAAGHEVAVAPALRLARGARDAVGLDHVQRAANLAGRVRLDPRGLPPPGAHVVLLDDVVTTGATAAACIGALAEGGFPVSAVLALTATSCPWVWRGMRHPA